MVWRFDNAPKSFRTSRHSGLIRRDWRVVICPPLSPSMLGTMRIATFWSWRSKRLTACAHWVAARHQLSGDPVMEEDPGRARSRDRAHHQHPARTAPARVYSVYSGTISLKNDVVVETKKPQQQRTREIRRRRRSSNSSMVRRSLVALPIASAPSES